MLTTTISPQQMDASMFYCATRFTNPCTLYYPVGYGPYFWPGFVNVPENYGIVPDTRKGYHYISG
jgi:hypothetical protein